MSSGQALALAAVIWLLAVALILTWIKGASRKPAPRGLIQVEPTLLEDAETLDAEFVQTLRKPSPKLYDPQTSEPSFWAAPAADLGTRKRPAR